MEPTDIQVTDTTVTPARSLRAAQQYLARHGWVQGSYYDTSAAVFTPAACVVGAIAMVCYGGPVEAPAQHFDTPEYLEFEAAVTVLDEFLVRARGQHTPRTCGTAYEFNDTKGRTHGEVGWALLRAAWEWETAHLRCPHCHRPVLGIGPTVWRDAEQGPAPEFSHVDGTPLCPGNGSQGTSPALPVLVEAGA